MKQYIVGLGEALWDCLPEGKKIGGAPANFAFHAGQFGHNSIAISAIGNDKLGEETLAEFDKKHVNYLMPMVDYPTGTVQVTLDEAGVPTYEIKEGVAWDNIPFTPEIEEVAKNCRAVCFGSLAQRHDASRSAILSFLKAMPEGSLRIFDINLRLQYYTRETIHTSLEHADILKLNDEEVPIVARLLGLEGDMEAVCRQVLTDYSLRAVILTRGADGCSIYHEKGSVFHPSACIKVADTVGAGDSFTAGFVSALLVGRSHLEAVALATRVAAFVCSHHGAMPMLPSEYRVVEA